MRLHCDVAVIGGGPAGSTCAGLLRRHAPDLSVHVFERERFPREHVGESQLPPIAPILHELGCWDAVEAAGFPIKVGATYRWGNSDQLWDFEFIPMDGYVQEPRPRGYSMQARQLAFQVDRAIYDRILLEHAAALGSHVHMPARVRVVGRDGDRVTHLLLDDGREVRARHYVDASGNAAVLRRAMGVQIDAPTRLQNIAFWDYWHDAAWAARYPGGATRVSVLSIGCGWIWFIPLGTDRTSIGFVCPREFHRQAGKSPAELYTWALQQEPLIAGLTANATREGRVRATRDWSFVADRAAGTNWLLAGEAAGFADPILAAGMTLAQTGGREAAYTLIALEHGEHDPDWLKHCYDDNQRSRIRQHIRFADFWYSANGVFSDLQDYTRQIARDAGLELSPQRAFQWLGTGGFTRDVLGQVGVGGLDLAGARQVAMRFVGGQPEWALSRVNRFRLDLEGASEVRVPAYHDGRIEPVACYLRGTRRLPVHGLFAQLLTVLEVATDITTLLPMLQQAATAPGHQSPPQVVFQHLLQALELMLHEGWVRGSHDPALPRLQLESPREGAIIHTNEALNRLLEVRARTTG